MYVEAPVPPRQGLVRLGNGIWVWGMRCGVYCWSIAQRAGGTRGTTFGRPKRYPPTGLTYEPTRNNTVYRVAHAWVQLILILIPIPNTDTDAGGE